MLVSIVQTTAFRAFRAPLHSSLPPVREMQDHCASCSLHNMCLPTGLKESEMRRLDNIIVRRRRVPRDGFLYRTNDSFKNLYAIKLGHFKTQRVDRNGAQQITGFQMPGELLGMDAIGGGQYQCDAFALEDSEVCEIPFSKLEELFADLPPLLRHFHRLMSQEITREQNVMLMLSNMRAEQQFSAFLVNLSMRYAARGYSSTSFQMRMSREDIGNYLGLTIESISRLLTRFKNRGLILVDKREIQLLDPEGLKALATGATACLSI